MRRVKKPFVALCALAFLVFAGCAQHEMYIAPAELSRQELAMAELLEGDALNAIYDFRVDERIKTIRVNAYELTDGKWELIMGGGGNVFTATEGRIALGIDRIPEYLRVAVQGGKNHGATVYRGDGDELTLPSGCATAILSKKVPLSYEEEIALAVQVITDKNEVRSFGPEAFYSPEVYDGYGYEHIYAVTVCFSEEEL